MTTAERDSLSRLGHRGRWPRLTYLPLPPLAFASGDGVNPREPKYLPSCSTRGFLTPANFKSKLSVRSLIWSAKSGTPRPSCICLLLTYQRALVRSEDTWIVTHVDSRFGCGQRTSTVWTHSPSWDGWAAYNVGLSSWRRDHASYSGGGTTILWVALFMTWSLWGDQVSRKSKVTPDNEMLNPFDWFPQEFTGLGLDKRRPADAKIISVLLETISQPPVNIVEVRLQVAVEQSQLAGPGCDSRVVRAEGQLDMVRRWGYVVDIYNEEERGDQSALSYSSPDTWTR